MGDSSFSKCGILQNNIVWISRLPFHGSLEMTFINVKIFPSFYCDEPARATPVLYEAEELAITKFELALRDPCLQVHRDKWFGSGLV